MIGMTTLGRLADSIHVASRPFSESRVRPPRANAFVAAKMAHYAWAEDGTTVQAHGIGPFVINYVNPADDPNKAGKK